MPDSILNAFILVFTRVVELQASLGPPRFDILLLEFIKHKHAIGILLSQEEMLLLSGLDYFTVALLQLNCRNK